MSSSKDGKVSSFHLFPRCLFQWDGGFSQRIKFHKMMTTQTPGGLGPPCCMNVGSADAVPADFHKKKIGQQSGGPGAKPPASLCVLSPRGERTWPRIGYPFSLGQRFICADKLQHALQKRVWPAHPPSLHKERGKRSARGSPPGPPRYFDF